MPNIELLTYYPPGTAKVVSPEQISPAHSWQMTWGLLASMAHKDMEEGAVYEFMQRGLRRAAWFKGNKVYLATIGCAGAVEQIAIPELA